MKARSTSTATSHLKKPVALPPCGMFVGSGVYPMSKDYLLATLYGHLTWAPQSFSPLEMIQKIIDDNQGNLAQFWGYARGHAPSVIAEWLYALDEIGITVPPPDWERLEHLRVGDCEELETHADRRGAGALRFAREAAKRGIYTAFIYTDGHPQWSRQLDDVGDHYLGYDFGERFTFRLGDVVAGGAKLEDVTLEMLADDLIERVKEHVDEYHATGWGNVMATSSNFYVDYEIIGGADIPVVEDFAFKHLNIASALSRGLYRQHGLPMWGSHLAHEHYSWIPNANPHKFDLLRAAMYQKYMTGSKMIINESGNWFVEASLCEDSPKHGLPRVPLSNEIVKKDPKAFAPYIAAAREHFHEIDYDSPIPRAYRKEISDFYDFVKEHPAPEGQPESTLAVIKGNYDLCGQGFSPNRAVGGGYALAQVNPAWLENAPERGWEIVTDVFYPLPPVLGDCRNQWLSGAPYGMVDIVSFAKDRIDAAFLAANYEALLFSGWNTCSMAQYETLKQYVMGGATLFVSIPHLSTNIRRDFLSYGVEELVNGGDFSDLCGVAVKGRGRGFHWATTPDGADELGFPFPRRFGHMGTPMGEIEVTDPSIETLVVEDEEARPLLLRRTCGEGTVYFLNSWAYPGALNASDGPGCRVDTKGMIGTIYQHIATRHRGNVWITDDGERTGGECEHVCYSYFPRSSAICLLNVDFDRPHGFFLHGRTTREQTELAPGEFRLLDASAFVPEAKPNVASSDARPAAVEAR